MTLPKKLTVEEIKARHRVVCICKAICLGRIQDAILHGCQTRSEIRERTGAGSGGCGGKRCGPVIEELLQRNEASVHSKNSGDTQV